MMQARFVLIFLALGILACGSSAETPDRQATLRAALYPSPTPDATQTPVLVEVTKVVQITVTPMPTEPTAKPTSTRQIKLCVTAQEAVHLRPSASLDGYPILQLANGSEVTDLKGRDGEWMFVQYRDKRGWVHEKYVGQCR